MISPLTSFFRPELSSRNPLRHSALLAGLCLSFVLTACAPQGDDKGAAERAETTAAQSAVPAESPQSEPASPAAKQASSGRVTYLDGPAEHFDAKGHTPLKAEQLVNPGESVHTGSKTKLELTFADGSKLRIGPAAEVKFAFRAQDDSALFQVDKGEIWGNVRPGARKLVFQGRHSTASVLGTVYNLDVTAERTCTRVIQGKVGVHRPFAIDGHGAEVIDNAPKRLTDAKADSDLEPAKDGDIVVPENKWLQMKTDQCMVVKDKGKAHVMVFSLDELAKQSEWLAWNRDRDKTLPPH